MFRTAGYILKPALRRFERALQRPEQTQQRLLDELLHDIARTAYGRSHGLKPGDGYDEFASRLPIVRYEDLEEWIHRQQQTEKQILTPEPVRFYEKTSGSSGAAKFIPYTDSLRRSFSRMFLLWLADLLNHGPQFRTGKIFMSISPAFRELESTGQGVRIGLEDDAEYLDGWMQPLLRHFLIAPPSLTRLQDPQNFKRVLSLFLLAEPKLETVSIWNPSFLEVMLDFIVANQERMRADMQRGTVDCEGMRFNFRRASAARLSLLSESTPDWQRVWPELKMLSCWTSAHAASAARRLAAKFPGVRMQGKGLLATEAPMTMPYTPAGGFVPLPAEVFYEFLDAEGRVFRLHELEAGKEYEIVLSQKGGLSRYRIGDRVRVTHFYQGSPCLEFVGRAGAVCDLVGEKLNEAFVRECLQPVLPADAFFTLVPAADQRHYRLLVDREVEIHSAEIDLSLCHAFHYRQARMLGQLGPVEVEVVANLRDEYFAAFLQRGMRLGDIKPSCLTSIQILSTPS